MEIFRKRFFYVLTVITLVLVLVPSVLSLMGLGSFVRAGFNVILTPVQKLFENVSDALDGYRTYFLEFDQLMAENEALRAELSELKEAAYQAEELASINDWLFGYLEMKREHSDFQMLAATVTSRSTGGYVTVFTLDKGTSSGVRKNMPVVTDAGILGYVSEVGLNWAKVNTLLDSAASIGVYDERSSDAGILEGSFEASRTGCATLRYLAADTDVEVGDRILSSGYGTVYPRGVTVGYVTAVEIDNLTRSPVATVTLSASAEGLERVVIITDFNVVEAPKAGG